jgi:plasmid maintenance system antidote protein VapI
MGPPVGRQAARSGRLTAAVARIGALLDTRPPGRRGAFQEHLDDMAREKPPTAPPTVSETLRAEILSRGLTAYAVARLAGVDTSVVARFLARERGLSMKTLDRLCEALELELQPVAKLEANPAIQPDRARKPLPGQGSRIGE